MSQNKTILSVLRSGGTYGPEHVKKLKYGVENASERNIRFVCLTDFDFIDFCEVIPLKHNWDGWWSKIELFRPDLGIENAIYFDLDVIILRNIDELIKLSEELLFCMLKGWNTVGGIHPSSSIMCGRFDLHTDVYEIFAKDPVYYKRKLKRKVGAGMQGDQGFIIDIIGDKIPYLQDHLPKDYIIGKRMYKKNIDLINKAHILSWSGNPRIHTVKELWDYEITNTISDTKQT